MIMLNRLAHMKPMLFMAAMALGLIACGKEPAPAPATTGTTPAATPATGEAAPQATPAATPVAGEPAAGAPTAVPVAQASPIAIPEVVEGDEAGLVGYVRLRDPNNAINRIGAWISLIQPMMNADMLRQQLAAMGLDVTKLRSGGNLTVAALAPGEGAMQPSIAAVIPAAPDSEVAKAVGMNAPGSAAGKAGNDTLLAQDAPTLQRAEPMGTQLASLNDAPISSDLQIYVNVAPLMQQFGPMLRSQATMMQSMMMGAAMNAGQGGPSQAQLQNMQQMMGVQMQAFFDALDMIKSASINANFDPAAIDLSTVVNPKTGTGLAAFMAGPPASAPDLAQFLPANAQIKMQMSVSDTAQLMSVYKKYMTQLMPVDAGDQAQRMNALLDKFAAMGPFDYAYSIGLAENQGMVLTGVMNAKDPQQVLQLIRDNAADMKAAMMGQMMGGADYDVTHQQNVRQVQGQPVDQMTITLKMPAEMAADQRAMLQKMWGGETVTMEVMPLGNYLLYSSRPIDELAAQVASGSGTTQLAARQAFEPGANFYMDFDLATYMNQIMSIARQSAGAPAAAPIAAPPVTLAAYNQGGKGYYRLRIPRELVTAIRDSASQSPMTPPPGQGMTPGQM